MNRSDGNLSGKITRQQVIRWLPAFQQGRLSTVGSISKSKKDFEVKSGIIAHSDFLFLKFAETNEIHAENLNEITQEFDSMPAAVKVYDATYTPAGIKYSDYLGHTIRVYDNNQIQHVCKLNRLVYVFDIAHPEPYLAIALEAPQNADLYYAFATTSKRLNPYPFTEVTDTEMAILAVEQFDSLTEWQRIKTETSKEANTDFIPDAEITVKIAEVRKNERYVFVQSVFTGNCGSLHRSYAALYHVTRDNWVQEAEGELTLFIKDLIDLDGDLYPELLMTDFATTAIYEINYKGFDEVNKMSWSTDECPC